MTISAVILTHNSEKTLERAIRSVDWCNEIIVIDDYSADKTLEIARKYKARIFRRKLNNDFAGQRNYGLKKAKNDWVFFLDSDEEVSEKLKNSILKVVGRENVFGVIIKRQDIWFGKKLFGGEWGRAKLLRLGHKKKGRWRRKVHELWEIDKGVSEIDGILFHYPHPTISEFLNHVKIHSLLHANENIKENKKSGVWKPFIIPAVKFIQNFIFKRGYLDGERGFIYAVFMSFHSFISWSQLWLKTEKR